jgi:hypothetical protein
MILRIVLLAISWILLAAHFSRADLNLIAIFCLLLPFILITRKKWALKLLVVLTVLGSLVWVHTTWQLINSRLESGEDWNRMAIILFSVAIYTLFSAIFINSPRIRKKFNS